MFEGIGKIGDYAARQQLQRQAQEKLHQKQGDGGAEMNLAEPQTLLDLAGDDGRWRLLAITNKLSGGSKLTPAEMNYLRQKSPDLYEKASRIAERRADFEQRLNLCRSKAEAGWIRLEAVPSVVDAKQNGGDLTSPAEPVLLGRALEQSWFCFAGSRKYKELAAAEAERRADRERRKL